jgi:Na+/H+ antiporter NhaD/arsenite permease-like protein
MEYGELFLFLLVAITYVNTLEERRVFDVLRVKLTGRNLSYRSLFWLTGFLAFFLSSVLDNLTTALIMGAVVMAIRPGRRAVTVSSISIVVAANAGGFLAFGDITTLMVWQNQSFLRILFLHAFADQLAEFLIMQLAFQDDA